MDSTCPFQGNFSRGAPALHVVVAGAMRCKQAPAPTCQQERGSDQHGEAEHRSFRVDSLRRHAVCSFFISFHFIFYFLARSERDAFYELSFGTEGDTSAEVCDAERPICQTE